MDFYIVNLSHAKPGDRYISLWRPECKGYAWPLPWAGRYPEAVVRENLGYYNNGENLAVPCELIESMAVAPAPGEVDGDAGPVVPATRENWKLLLAAAIEPPAYPQRLHRRGPMLFTDATPPRRATPPTLRG